VSNQPVAITGIGVITPVGIGFEELSEGIGKGRSGIAEITNFDAEALPIQYAGEARAFDLANHIGSIKTYLDRTSALALAAAAMALGDSQWIGNMPGAEIGLCLGTAWGCEDSIELYTRKLVESQPKFAPPLVFTNAYANAPNSLVSIEFGLRGHNACFSGGATAGAAALQSALDLIRRDKSQRLLAGAADALSEVAVRACIAEGIVTSDLCRPFDSSADGLLPAEGAALLALESAESALNRKAGIMGYLLGSGSSGGASCADAVSRAIALALDDAGCGADAVDAVFASASGLPAIDAAEAKAIAGLPARPPVVALKSLIGDPMGAWAPVGVAAALCCIDGGVLPATARLREAVSAEINILREPLEATPGICLILNVEPSGYAAALIVRGPGE